MGATMCIFIVSINPQRNFRKEELWCLFHKLGKQHGQDLNSSISDSNDPIGSEGNIHDQITLLDMMKLKVVPPRAQITQFPERRPYTPTTSLLH